MTRTSLTDSSLGVTTAAPPHDALFTGTPSISKLFEFWRVPLATNWAPFSTLKMLSVAPAAPTLLPGRLAAPPPLLRAPSPKTPAGRLNTWEGPRQKAGRAAPSLAVGVPPIMAVSVSIGGAGGPSTVMD